jgi:hypothetical protein
MATTDPTPWPGVYPELPFALWVVKGLVKWAMSNVPAFGFCWFQMQHMILGYMQDV